MDNKEIRFIDSRYNELFRIKDGESITVTLADGAKTDRKCTYLDDYHTQIGFNKFHICEFAEIMERGGSTYRPKDVPSYTLEKIDQSEFEYMYKLSDESQNRGCICYIRGYFDNSIDERLQTTAMVENKDKRSLTSCMMRMCKNMTVSIQEETKWHFLMTVVIIFYVLWKCLITKVILSVKLICSLKEQLKIIPLFNRWKRLLKH